MRGRAPRCASRLSLPLDQELRYGDNPHQKARSTAVFSECFSQLQGKELSYTNILDIEAAADLILDFVRPTVAILKHTNPCGVGQDDEDLRVAWQKAFETDRQAPFGGVIVCNRPLTEGLARVISEIFTDVIIAPDFEAEARAVLQKKKNLRLMKMQRGLPARPRSEPVIRSAPGGLMVMDRDHTALGLDNLEEKVVTKRPPTEEEMRAMRFAWRVVKHVKSNAIVYRLRRPHPRHRRRPDEPGRFLPDRGLEGRRRPGLSLKGSVIASDAMFPFADGLQAAIEAGATACIQPGGSIRDEEVIDGRRRGRHGDGLHRAPALPALSALRIADCGLRTVSDDSGRDGLLLGVNIDHVATLRQARYALLPDSPNAEPSVRLRRRWTPRRAGRTRSRSTCAATAGTCRTATRSQLREKVGLPLNLETRRDRRR